jgi:hypothetical protein
MSGSTTNASGRITLESLKETNEIPFVGWDSTNTAFIIGAGFIGALLGQRLGIGLPGVGLSVTILMYVAYDFVRSTPPYVNAIGWIRTNLKYWRRPSQYANAAEAHVQTESTLRAAVETPETTRNLTGIARLYPPHGIIEHQEGGYSIVLRYEPPNMDFNTNDEYIRLMDTLATGYNETADFDVTLHMTTRPVDIEAYFTALANRMDDPDVQNNEIFKALLQEMKNHRAEMLEKTDTETSHFYFLVTVNENEVKNTVGGDDDAQERSRLFRILSRSTSADEESSERRRQRRMKKKLEERTQTLARILTETSTGSQTSLNRVPVTEAASIHESLWTGRRVPLDPEEENNPVPTMGTMRGPRPSEVDIDSIEGDA